jgi:hypothetical protein
MAVTGITQESGKTTTLEALINRSGLRAVAFITKRGEGTFTTAARIPAYFKERCDWRFVSTLLEAYLGEKTKSERPYIMRACEGAATLADVQKNIEAALKEAKGSREETAYYTLGQYFAELVPEIAKIPQSAELQLAAGINVIDLSGYSEPVQGLVIGSVLDWVLERENNVITLVPEAWEFIPRARTTPCKAAAIRLARKGACSGNFLWLDSQDLAAVDIEVRKMLSVYLLGVQREANEVQRTIDHIPESNRRPRPSDVMKLSRGWFYACYERELFCTYVQPTWLDCEPDRARIFARDLMPASYVAPRERKIRRRRQAPETITAMTAQGGVQ